MFKLPHNSKNRNQLQKGVIYNNSYPILKGLLGTSLSYLGPLSSTAIFPKLVGTYLILPENSFQLGNFLLQSTQPGEFIFLDALHCLSSDFCFQFLLRFFFIVCL
jgi:hypothetical protein